MAIEKITNTIVAALKRKTYLPDRPTAQGYKPEHIKKALTGAITDENNSLVSEINRIVAELNERGFVAGKVTGTVRNAAKDEQAGVTVTDKGAEGVEIEIICPPVSGSGTGSTIDNEEVQKLIDASIANIEIEFSKKVNVTDIVDDLSSSETDKPLSAKQGKTLNDAKLDKTAIVNGLTSGDSTKVLSALQGKVLKELIDKIQTLLASDDLTLDTVQEIVDYIKQNKTLIDYVSTNKVNKTDIVDDLTSDDGTKPLSAAQGKILNNTKLDKIAITNDLTTDDPAKALSAKQGKALNDTKFDKANVETAYSTYSSEKVYSVSGINKFATEVPHIVLVDFSTVTTGSQLPGPTFGSSELTLYVHSGTDIDRDSLTVYPYSRTGFQSGHLYAYIAYDVGYTSTGDAFSGSFVDIALMADYTKFDNKPQINCTELKGNKAHKDFGLFGVLRVGAPISKLVFNTNISTKKVAEFCTALTYDVSTGMTETPEIAKVLETNQNQGVYSVDLSKFGGSGYGLAVCHATTEGFSILQVLFISELSAVNQTVLQQMGLTDFTYTSAGWQNTAAFTLIADSKIYSIVGLTENATTSLANKVSAFIAEDTALWDAFYGMQFSVPGMTLDGSTLYITLP